MSGFIFGSGYTISDTIVCPAGGSCALFLFGAFWNFPLENPLQWIICLHLRSVFRRPTSNGKFAMALSLLGATLLIVNFKNE